MPLTPFAGLSVVLHLLVILLYGLLYNATKQLEVVPTEKRRRSGWPTRCLSVLIIVGVFSITAVSATTMVLISINDEYSSIAYAGNLYLEASSDDDYEVIIIPYAVNPEVVIPFAAK